MRVGSFLVNKSQGLLVLYSKNLNVVKHGHYDICIQDCIVQLWRIRNGIETDIEKDWVGII